MSDGLTDRRSQVIYGQEFLEPATVDKICDQVRDAILKRAVSQFTENMSIAELNVMLTGMRNDTLQVIMDNVEIHHE